MVQRWTSLTTVFAGRCISEHDKFIAYFDCQIEHYASRHSNARSNGKLRGLKQIAEGRIDAINKFIAEHRRLYGDFDKDRIDLFEDIICKLKGVLKRADAVDNEALYSPQYWAKRTEERNKMYGTPIRLALKNLPQHELLEADTQPLRKSPSPNFRNSPNPSSTAPLKSPRLPIFATSQEAKKVMQYLNGAAPITPSPGAEPPAEGATPPHSSSRTPDNAPAERPLPPREPPKETAVEDYGPGALAMMWQSHLVELQKVEARERQEIERDSDRYTYDVALPMWLRLQTAVSRWAVGTLRQVAAKLIDARRQLEEEKEKCELQAEQLAAVLVRRRRVRRFLCACFVLFLLVVAGVVVLLVVYGPVLGDPSSFLGNVKPNGPKP